MFMEHSVVCRIRSFLTFLRYLTLFISEHWLPSNCLPLLSTLSDDRSVSYIPRHGTTKNGKTRSGIAFLFSKNLTTRFFFKSVKHYNMHILWSCLTFVDDKDNMLENILEVLDVYIYEYVVVVWFFWIIKILSCNFYH